MKQRLLQGAHLRDAWIECGQGDGLTYPASAPVKRIDYLFLVGRLRCSSATVIESTISDHRPLLVVVLASWGAPLVFDGTWLALTNAVTFGWLCAGALWLLGWLVTFIRPLRQQFYIPIRRAAA